MSRQINDLLQVVTAKPALYSFLRSLKHHSRTLSRQEWRAVQGVLINLIFMLIEVTTGSDPLTCEGVPIPSRQRFVREQGLIDLLVTILQETFQKGRFDVGGTAIEELSTRLVSCPIPHIHRPPSYPPSVCMRYRGYCLIFAHCRCAGMSPLIPPPPIRTLCR